MVITTHLTVTPLTVIHLPATPISAMRPAVEDLTSTETVLGFATTPAIPPVTKPVTKPVMPTIVTITQEVAVEELTLLVPAQPLKTAPHTMAVQVAQVEEPMVFVAVTVVEDEERKALEQMVQFQQVAVQS
jgi:hypothetical protein